MRACQYIDSGTYFYKVKSSLSVFILITLKELISCKSNEPLHQIRAFNNVFVLLHIFFESNYFTFSRIPLDVGSHGLLGGVIYCGRRRQLGVAFKLSNFGKTTPRDFGKSLSIPELILVGSFSRLFFCLLKYTCTVTHWCMSDLGNPDKISVKTLHCGTARRSKEKTSFQLMEVNLHLLIKKHQKANLVTTKLMTHTFEI